MKLVEFLKGIGFVNGTFESEMEFKDRAANYSQFKTDFFVGKKFGDLTVVNVTKFRKGKWEFKCDCGVTVHTKGSSVLHGHTKSCGCKRKPPVGPVMTQFIGHKINKWTVLEPGVAKNKKWLFRCDCGTERLVVAAAVFGAQSKSCGCTNPNAFKRFKCDK